MMPSVMAALIVIISIGCLAPAESGPFQTRQTLAIRGHAQWLYVYGPRTGDPVIVSSGDGGWIHLGPHVAEFLSTKGFRVMGFDVKTYLSTFTSARSALRPEDEPADCGALRDPHRL